LDLLRVALVPWLLQVHFALTVNYAKAGWKEDATVERAEF